MNTFIEWYALGMLIAYLMLVFDHLKNEESGDKNEPDILVELLLTALSWATIVALIVVFYREYKASKLIEKKLENNGKEKTQEK